MDSKDWVTRDTAQTERSKKGLGKQTPPNEKKGKMTPGGRGNIFGTDVSVYIFSCGKFDDTH